MLAKVIHRRILAALLILAAILMIVFSRYINTRVIEGREKLARAQKQLSHKSIFSLVPVVSQVGDQMGESAQQQINEGELKANHYEQIAIGLQVGGIVFALAGSTIALFGWRREEQ